MCPSKYTRTFPHKEVFFNHVVLKTLAWRYSLVVDLERLGSKLCRKARESCLELFAQTTSEN